MQPLQEVVKFNPDAVVLASRSAGLRLGLGSGTLVFTGGVVDAKAEEKARKRLEKIHEELAALPGIADREQRAERARELGNERNGCLAQLDRELGVAVVPKTGEILLDRGQVADAGAVLELARGHRLYESGPVDSEGFWEVAA